MHPFIETLHDIHNSANALQAIEMSLYTACIVWEQVKKTEPEAMPKGTSLGQLYRPHYIAGMKVIINSKLEPLKYYAHDANLGISEKETFISC